ncbi:DNA-binding response OmpR family regulator [Azospirillum fermentarium]|uniref:response regulator n=1 Tax=Azospirillum fermentarium TaxID=1233114 RepID=UPI002227CD9C|nr:response regulator [Azospirillum fermentarium]MCW2246139.1 DNA-binding response OmpR family regulator [Azospirillum fermentarium]
MTNADLKRVLYVDDDPMLRALVRLLLEKMGGLVVEDGCDPGQVVAQARAFGPDMILLDMNLPGRSGLEVLESLRAEADLRGVPVVFVTAGATTEDAARYRALGAAGVIAKPFSPATFLTRVRALWQGGGG